MKSLHIYQEINFFATNFTFSRFSYIYSKYHLVIREITNSVYAEILTLPLKCMEEIWKVRSRVFETQMFSFSPPKLLIKRHAQHENRKMTRRQLNKYLNDVRLTSRLFQIKRNKLKNQFGLTASFSSWIAFFVSFQVVLVLSSCLILSQIVSSC